MVDINFITVDSGGYPILLNTNHIVSIYIDDDSDDDECVIIETITNQHIYTALTMAEIEARIEATQNG